MSSAEIFRTYLQRFTSGDTAGAAELLASARLIFDTAAMAALMSGS
jgi:hypothetical protein